MALLNDPMICHSESSEESLQMLNAVKHDRLIHRLIMQRLTTLGDSQPTN